MDVRLTITIVGYIISTLFMLGLGLFVYLRGPRRTPNLVFFLMSLSLCVFNISHIIGITVADHELSRSIFMWNLTNIFMGIFICHFCLITAGRAKDLRNVLIVIYAIGFALLGFYLVYPSSFLLTSVPKLYLPNYYVPGPFHWIMRAYFGIVATFGAFHLILAYRKGADPVQRNRIKYALAAVIFGSIVGSSAVLLVYDIPFDPMWSMFFSLYTLPFAYGIVRYELMDIRIVAKKALSYALGAGGATLLIVFFQYADTWVRLRLPAFPTWVFTFLGALVAIGVGYSVWKKIKESETLKNDFIATVSHKFNQPLSRIGDIAERIGVQLSEKDAAAIEELKNEDARLIEVTRLLTGLAASEDTASYSYAKIDLAPMVQKVLSSNEAQIAKKNLAVTWNGQDHSYVIVDSEKMQFVIQSLIENAIAYTAPGRSLVLLVARRGENIQLQIKDDGVGIALEELPHVFDKFYRSASAKQAHPEGMGIALHLSQSIVQRHGGILTAESPGLGKGTTFTLLLRAAN